MCVTFFCEADFLNFDYFIIEFSDHSVYFKYQIPEENFKLFVVKLTIILIGKILWHNFVSLADKKCTLNGINCKRKLGNAAYFELNCKKKSISLKFI